jgi:hypothetical protein
MNWLLHLLKDKLITWFFFINMNCMKCPCLSVTVIWQGSRTVDISVCSRIRSWRGTKWGTNLMYDKGLEHGTWRYYAVLEGEEVQNGEETWKLVLTGLQYGVLTSLCQSHIDDLSWLYKHKLTYMKWYIGNVLIEILYNR